MAFVGKNNVHNVQYTKIGNHRFFLKITVNRTPKRRVVLILKNPSTTCNNMPDGTMNKISSFSCKKLCHIDRTTGKLLRKLKTAYDEIIVLNLYSLYSPNPVAVCNFYYKTTASSILYLLLNNLYILSTLNNYSGDIICAWGRPNGIPLSEYRSQINFVKGIIQNKKYRKFEYNRRTNSFVRFHSNYPPYPFSW